MLPDLITTYHSLDRASFQNEDEKQMIKFIDHMFLNLPQIKSYLD